MNSSTPDVRKRAAGTRGDRRTIRTRRALGIALVDLMLAREFDRISVQQLLDRAGVGRATFYAHFRNKEDLLLSDAERFIGHMEARFLARDAGSRRVAPVAELFSHVADVERFERALDRSHMREAVYGLLAGHLARLIERRIAVIRPDATAGTLSLGASSRVFAGVLLELLRWWLERPARPGPHDMDARFHEIVWGGIAALTPPSAPSR